MFRFLMAFGVTCFTPFPSIRFLRFAALHFLLFSWYHSRFRAFTFSAVLCLQFFILSFCNLARCTAMLPEITHAPCHTFLSASYAATTKTRPRCIPKHFSVWTFARTPWSLGSERKKRGAEKNVAVVSL